MTSVTSGSARRGSSGPRPATSAIRSSTRRAWVVASRRGASSRNSAATRSPRGWSSVQESSRARTRVLSSLVTPPPPAAPAPAAGSGGPGGRRGQRRRHGPGGEDRGQSLGPARRGRTRAPGQEAEAGADLDLEAVEGAVGHAGPGGHPVEQPGAGGGAVETEDGGQVAGQVGRDRPVRGA